MPAVDGVNYPGPFEIRINYSAPAGGFSLLSQLRVNVDVNDPPEPGSPFGDYVLPARLGPFYDAASFVDAFVALLKVVYKTDASFVNAELWKYQPGTFNADFQSAYTIGVAGISTGTAQTNYQAIITIRSQLGGHVRCSLSHMVSGGAVTDPYPFAISAYNDIADFYTDLQSPILARDGGYLFSPMNLLVGQNEHLWKKFFRP